MVEEVPIIDWNGSIFSDAAEGMLMEQLERIPRSRWHEAGLVGYTLLHLACRGDNVDAAKALLAQGVDLDARDMAGWSPAHHACRWAQKRMLKVLCDAGASMQAKTNDGLTVLELCLLFKPETVPVLLIHGRVRLSTVRADMRGSITPSMWALDGGIVRCRAAAVAMMRVKHGGRLAQWDKFLLRLLARHVWTTRAVNHWQTQ